MWYLQLRLAAEELESAQKLGQLGGFGMVDQTCEDSKGRLDLQSAKVNGADGEAADPKVDGTYD